MIYKSAIGQDSHRFVTDVNEKVKPLLLGGVLFDGINKVQGEDGKIIEMPLFLSANSDGDVVLHSITNAISGITCVNVLGAAADEMHARGIDDSREYLKEALKDLKGRIVHVSMTIECKRPKIMPKIPEMRKAIGQMLSLPETSVGITATTGEGLTDFGLGLGIQVFTIITVEEA